VYTGKGQSVPRNVVSVRFALNVTEVEDHAFEDCYDLIEVVLNDGLKKIGIEAFRDCSSLESITLPSTVIEIDKEAFSCCTSLQSINIPSTITDIGPNAFSSCIRLQEVELHEGLQTIGACAFTRCESLESINLPSTLTEIGNRAFIHCFRLQEVRLHESLETIGYRAFVSCSSLERFTFPSISTRLNNVVEVQTEANRIRQLNEIDAIRGDMIVRRGSELFVPGAVVRGGSNWTSVKASIDQIVSWIRYHEIKEATSLFELALWKARLDQADEATDINRGAYRIEVPGPVKDAILQYL